MRPIGDSLLPLRTHVTGYGWVRLLPMAGAVGFVGLLHVPQVEPSAWDWLIAVASAAAVPAGGAVRCRWCWPSASCSSRA